MVRSFKPSFRFSYPRAAMLAAMVAALIFASFFDSIVSQEKKPDPPQAEKKEDGKVPDQKELEKNRKKGEATKLSPVETIVEVAILAYGGRPNLEAARKSVQEVGTIRLATD